MDENLIRRLYKKYQKELYLYLYSLCKSRELAEDLLQETFLKAILSLSAEHTNMRAWLYMVARNLYFNYSKNKRNFNFDIDKLGDTLASEDSDMPDRMIKLEGRRLMYQALQKLDGIKKEILILQYFCGLSQKEIAAMLHITPENVRVQAYRGKRELRKFMEANGYDIL